MAHTNINLGRRTMAKGKKHSTPKKPATTKKRASIPVAAPDPTKPNAKDRRRNRRGSRRYALLVEGLIPVQTMQDVSSVVLHTALGLGELRQSLMIHAHAHDGTLRSIEEMKLGGEDVAGFQSRVTDNYDHLDSMVTTLERRLLEASRRLCALNGELTPPNGGVGR
jgi:hypothetical protein